MNSGEIVSSIISGISVLILAGIGKAVLGLRGDFHRFMAEHVWLISTSLWTRDKVLRIMDNLGMPVDQPPPNNLPPRKE